MSDFQLIWQGFCSLIVLETCMISFVLIGIFFKSQFLDSKKKKYERYIKGYKNDGEDN